MKYSTERIRELARIAHVALTDDEVEALRGELGALHSFAEALENAPVGVGEEDPFADAVPISSLRPDVTGECLVGADLPAAERTADGYFCVPRTVEENV